MSYILPFISVMQSLLTAEALLVAVIAACTSLAFIAIFLLGYMYHRLHKERAASKSVDYPTYGITGPSFKRTKRMKKSVSDEKAALQALDAKLASSAQLYHYQQTKQHLAAIQKTPNKHEEKLPYSSDSDSDLEQFEGSSSVYECSGLASTTNIELNNPLFQAQLSPSSRGSPPLTSKYKKPGHMSD